MPTCPHCHQYYFGEPSTCPKCHFHFAEKRVVMPDELRKKEEIKREEIKTEKEKLIKAAERKELLVLQNAHYEYCTEFLNDLDDGHIDKKRLDQLLNRYARSGWKLHSVFVNEIGKNASNAGFGGFSSGTNATAEITVLIFERCIKPAEK